MPEPALFWRENEIAVVILLRVLARECCSMRKQFIKCWKFYHFGIGRGLKPLSIKTTVPTIVVKKKYDETFRSIYVFEDARKNVKLNLVLVVLLVLESKGLYW